MLPKFNLVYFSSKILSYRELNNKIFKEDLLSNSRGTYFEFQNTPLAGWKVSFVPCVYVPVGARYAIDAFIFTHPNYPNVQIPIGDFHLKMNEITIEKGVIKEELILLSDGYHTSFISENNPDYQKNLNLLAQNSTAEITKIKDLSIGDIITYDGFGADSSAIFLGPLFVRECSYSGGDRLLQISNPKKVFLFLIDGQIQVKATAPKNILWLDHTDIYDGISISEALNSQQLTSIPNVEELQLYRFYETKYYFVEQVRLFPTNNLRNFYSKFMYFDSKREAENGTSYIISKFKEFSPLTDETEVKENMFNSQGTYTIY